MIFAPMLAKQRENSLQPPHPSETVPKKNDVFRLTGFRAAFVFDVEQTEGKPLPEFSKTTGNPREFADKLKEFVAKRESRWNTTSPFPQPRESLSEAKFG